MKNLIVLTMFTGLLWFLGSVIVQISQMNTERAAKIILGQKVEQKQQGPILDEKKVKEFIKSFQK